MGDLVKRCSWNNLKLPPYRQIHLWWVWWSLVVWMRVSVPDIFPRCLSTRILLKLAPDAVSCWWDSGSGPHRLRKSLLLWDVLVKDSDTLSWGQSPCRPKAITPLPPGLWMQSPPTGPISPSLRVNSSSEASWPHFATSLRLFKDFPSQQISKPKCCGLDPFSLGCPDCCMHLLNPRLHLAMGVSGRLVSVHLPTDPSWVD